MYIPRNKITGVTLLGLGVAIVLIYVLFVSANHSRMANAQDETLNMKLRLEQLRDSIEAENRIIGIQFVVPISEGDNYWQFGNPNDERALTIEEIGTDYFCFSQRGGQAVLIRCMPFTNIASFDYLGD